MQDKTDYYKLQFDRMLDKLNKIEKKLKVTSKERDTLKLKTIVLINNQKNQKG